MALNSKLWRVAGAAFVVINVGGAIWAAANGEWAHASVHAGLLIGALVAWPIASRARRQNLPDAQAEERLQYLQQSVDAIALEVERIGEAQRFNEKLRAERVENPEPER